ncbi:MAG TPA: HAD family hydrolase [Candidatus Dormibacteraeota bacterium]|nr:HAD family hydrolase [Candidatus Dormibacteraeota bacterium]
MRLAAGIEVDAVGFDLDHTLGFDDGLELRLMVRYALATPGGAAEGEPSLTSRAAALLAEARAGRRTIDEAVIALLEAHLGPEQARLAAVRWRDDAVAAVPSVMRAAPGMQGCVEWLERHGISLAVLTNGWSPLQQTKLRALGLERLPILVSDEIGARKPAASAFASLVDLLGARAERTAYVGDDLSGDALGAHAASLAAVWISRSDPSPEEVAALPCEVLTIRSLDALVPEEMRP